MRLNLVVRSRLIFVDGLRKERRCRGYKNGLPRL